jgi:glycogen operon protein
VDAAEGPRPGATGRLALAGLRPGARDLAVLAALTVRLQPELLRALRRRCLPRLDASAEADLWWSDIISARGPQGVSISSPVLRLLREELQKQYQKDPDLVGLARSLVKDYHAFEPPTVVLEESVAWAAIRGDKDTAEAELSRVLRTLIAENRTGLVDWWPVAWARLPELARRTAAAGRLNVATSYLLGPDAIPDLEADGQIIDDSLASALRSVPDTQLGVLRLGTRLELGDVDPERGAAIAVPAIPQLLLDLEWRAGDGSIITEQISFPGGTVTREVGTGPVRLRTARGAVFEVPSDTSRVITPARSVVPPQPGALYDGAGTAFTLFSSVAWAVMLCLFDASGREEQAAMTAGPGGLWQCYLSGVGPGQRYGYRVDGPWDPAQGLLANPAKLLLDPYARAIDGDVSWNQSVFGYQQDDPDQRNDDDSADSTPRSVVVSSSFDWGADRPPRHSYADTILYEAHVKGLTARHPRIPPELRGTYAAVAHPAMIEHFSSLGVTAVELMPVHQFITSQYLADRGLTNYWGYDTIGFFAPHHGYSSGSSHSEQVDEFKSMVRTLHENDIEVILDVVYNHTAEGGSSGPTLSFRGLDNEAYYRLAPGNKREHMDTTGSGNSLNAYHSYSLQLMTDSLRYWVTEMHVDGFRFDLAPTLARQEGAVDRMSVFLQLMQQDPVLADVKLIAEPWDIGQMDSYQLGRFPAQWSELNGRYRDTMRDFWRSHPVGIGEVATRLTGSGDLYQQDTRRPTASVNFIISHDGFTLHDLVSYDQKHNEANGENNHDGTSDNRSWNCGVEGPTDEPAVLELRARQSRVFLLTLMLSQGIPMISHGDELGRTQAGNNNAWCQDNELSWIDWDNADLDLFAFTRRIIQFRREHPVFRQQRFLGESTESYTSGDLPDIGWFTPAGNAMTAADWADPSALAFAMFLNGGAISEPDSRGRRIVDDSFLVAFNAWWEPLDWTIPARLAASWAVVIDTADPSRPGNNGTSTDVAHSLQVAPRSIQVLRAEGTRRAAERRR